MVFGEAKSVKGQSLLCSDPVGDLLEMLCLEMGPHGAMDREGAQQQGSEQRQPGRPGSSVRDEDRARDGEPAGVHEICWAQKAPEEAGFVGKLQDRDKSAPDYECNRDGQSMMESHGSVDTHEHDNTQQNAFLSQTFRRWMFSLGTPKLPWNMPHPMESLRVLSRRVQVYVLLDHCCGASAGLNLLSFLFHEQCM